MKQVFPEIAEDPDYGINSDHPKLIGLSNEQWNAFYEDYTKGIEGGLSQTFDALKCEHVPISDSTTWDAVLAEAIITPRNARPSDYAIIFVIRANDRDVAQLVTNETLILGSDYHNPKMDPNKENRDQFSWGVSDLFQQINK